MGLRTQSAFATVEAPLRVCTPADMKPLRPYASRRRLRACAVAPAASRRWRIRRAASLSGARLLLQYPRALSHRQPDARPMLDSAGEDFAGPTETIAGIEQAIRPDE
jgi:hypothetical protein